MNTTNTNAQIEERRTRPSKLPDGVYERRGWTLKYGPERREYQEKWCDPRWFELNGNQYSGKAR